MTDGTGIDWIPTTVLFPCVYWADLFMYTARRYHTASKIYLPRTPGSNATMGQENEALQRPSSGALPVWRVNVLNGQMQMAEHPLKDPIEKRDKGYW